jgi:hypothetical protein
LGLPWSPPCVNRSDATFDVQGGRLVYALGALKNVGVEAMRLTRLDREVIRRLAASGTVPADRDAFLAAQDPTWQGLERCRERDECWSKLAALGLVAE